MKNFLILLFAAGLIATTSCNESSKSSDMKTPADSLSYYLALSNATQYQEYIKHSPDSAKFNKDQFLKGFETIMKSDTANHSYMEGIQMALQMQQLMQMAKSQLGADLNKDVIVKTIKEALDSKTPAMDPNTLQTKVMALAQQMQMSKNAEKASKNLKAGEEYLAKQMKADKSIKVLPSGLAYKVIKEGDGNKFAKGSEVDVIYTGAFVDGQQFDSSNGQPVKFNTAQVVPGFAEGLGLMSPGAHYILYIPGKLGYGEQGNQAIGPNEFLIFDVQTPSTAEVKALQAKTNGAQGQPVANPAN